MNVLYYGVSGAERRFVLPLKCVRILQGRFSQGNISRGNFSRGFVSGESYNELTIFCASDDEYDSNSFSGPPRGLNEVLGQLEPCKI
jgi:hypothetical protein